MAEFEKLCGDLRVKALARESVIAKGIRNAAPLYAKILNDQDCIRKFVEDMLKIDGYGIQLKYSEKGQLRVYDANYEILGTNIKGNISDERWRSMLDIGNTYLDKNNGERDNGLYDRLMGIMLEEVGEKVLDYNIDKTDFSSLFSVEKSNNINWDTEIKFSNPFPEIDKSFYDLRSGLQLDHKANLDNFHIVDKTLSEGMMETVREKAIDGNDTIQGAIMSVVLPYKIGGDAFPIYYSIRDGKVLLTSEILLNPSKFYLHKLPIPNPEKVLQKIRDEYKEATGLDGGNILGGIEEDLRKEIVFDAIKALNENIRTASLWYGRR